MGYLIAFIDTDKIPKSFTEYEYLYGCIPDECGANGYHVASEPLQRLFIELKEFVRPLNGEFAAKDEDIDSGEYLDADYVFSANAIWVEVAYQDIEALYPKFIELSQKHNVAFYDSNGRVILPAKQWDIVVKKEFDRRNTITMYLACILAILGLISLFSHKWYLVAMLIIICFLMALITNRWIKRVNVDMQAAYSKMID